LLNSLVFTLETTKIWSLLVLDFSSIHSVSPQKFVFFWIRRGSVIFLTPELSNVPGKYWSNLSFLLVLKSWLFTNLSSVASSYGFEVLITFSLF
jgi:hypothetical protein